MYVAIDQMCHNKCMHAHTHTYLHSLQVFGSVQRCGPFVVPQVNIHTKLQEVLHNILVTIVTGRMQQSAAIDASGTVIRM